MDEESKRSARESCEYPGYDPPSFARSEALSLAPVSLLEPIVPLIESRRENILLSSSLSWKLLVSYSTSGGELRIESTILKKL